MSAKKTTKAKSPTKAKGTGKPVVRRTTKTVRDKNGMIYTIPVNESGRVPREVLYRRFMDTKTGSRKGKKRNVSVDTARKSDRVYRFENDPTPEELLKTGWWQHPNESDIEGIDTPGYYGKVSKAKAKKKTVKKAPVKYVIYGKDGKTMRPIGADGYTTLSKAHGIMTEKTAKRNMEVLKKANRGTEFEIRAIPRSVATANKKKRC